MSYTDDPDIWQTESAKAGSSARNLAPERDIAATAQSSQTGAKTEPLDQRRLDLKTIMELLSRAANDLRAAERRVTLAEERAKRADALLAEATERARAAEQRAENSEALERKVTAQAVRAFETMKERIAESDAKAREAQLQAQQLEASSKSALNKIDARSAAIEKAAENRTVELEARLQVAEMRLEAVRRALGTDDNRAKPRTPHAAFLPQIDEAIDLRVRH